MAQQHFFVSGITAVFFTIFMRFLYASGITALFRSFSGLPLCHIAVFRSFSGCPLFQRLSAFSIFTAVFR